MGDTLYGQYTKEVNVTSQFKLTFDSSIGSKDNNNIRRLYHGHNYSYTTIWASADRGHSPHCTGMICYGDTLSAPGPRAATRYFENNRVRD